MTLTRFHQSTGLGSIISHPLVRLVQEMYFRHLYATVQPTLEQRCESWDNYCAIFNIMLSSSINMQAWTMPLHISCDLELMAWTVPSLPFGILALVPFGASSALGRTAFAFAVLPSGIYRERRTVIEVHAYIFPVVVESQFLQVAGSWVVEGGGCQKVV